MERALVKGSIILLVCFGIANVLGFAYQLMMARNLGVVDYGVLAVLFSMIYILGFLTESIQIVISKYSTMQKSDSKLKNLLIKSSRKAFYFALIAFGLYLLIAIPFSKLTSIDYSLIFVNSLMVFIAFVLPINRGILQGKKRFGSLGINIIVESGVKLVLALLFVYIGWRVYGAIAGAILGAAAAYLFSFISLRDIRKSKEEKSDVKGLYNYSKPAFFIIMAIMIFYSLDVIIAKIVFSPQISGAYAIASMLGKIIFLATQPISRAMFPISVEKMGLKKSSDNLLITSFAIIAVLIIGALGIFYFFPQLIVSIFSGKIIVESYSILFLLGLSFSVLSITNLILMYKLSLGKVRGYYLLFIFIAIQISLLFYFSHNLLEFGLAFLVSSCAFLFGSIVLLND